MSNKFQSNIITSVDIKTTNDVDKNGPNKFWKWMEFEDFEPNDEIYWL